MSDTNVIEPAHEADDEFALEQRLYEETLKTLDEGQVLHPRSIARWIVAIDSFSSADP